MKVLLAALIHGVVSEEAITSRSETDKSHIETGSIETAEGGLSAEALMRIDALSEAFVMGSASVDTEANMEAMAQLESLMSAASESMKSRQRAEMTVDAISDASATEHVEVGSQLNARLLERQLAANVRVLEEQVDATTKTKGGHNKASGTHGSSLLEKGAQGEPGADGEATEAEVPETAAETPAGATEEEVPETTPETAAEVADVPEASIGGEEMALINQELEGHPFKQAHDTLSKEAVEIEDSSMMTERTHEEIWDLMGRRHDAADVVAESVQRRNQARAHALKVNSEWSSFIENVGRMMAAYQYDLAKQHVDKADGWVKALVDAEKKEKESYDQVGRDADVYRKSTLNLKEELVANAGNLDKTVQKAEESLETIKSMEQLSGVINLPNDDVY